MQITYSYDEIIDELKEEIEDLLLEPSDTIQVLRSAKAIGNDYYPIVDWYYTHDLMMEEIEVEADDTKKEIANKKKIGEQYKLSQSLLQGITVAQVLEEMAKYNKPDPFKKFKK